MKFSGLQKTSLLDYPDKVASVLFTPGCNLRCPFCHNWRIAVNPQPPFLQEAAALEILESRKKYVDAVVVTGGEPCMHKELPKFLAKLKERGFLVKLDTNGFFPDVLEECLGNVDYVAMDVKTCSEKYKLLGAKTQLAYAYHGNPKNRQSTLRVPNNSGATNLSQPKTPTCIGEMVKGSKIHALQQFIPDDTLDKKYQASSLMRLKQLMNSQK